MAKDIQLVEKEGKFYKMVRGKEVEATPEEVEKFQAQNAGAGEQGGAKETGVKESIFFVWLKNMAYISDTERLASGVYKLTKVPERLLKLKSNSVEIFEGTIPPRDLAKIARWAGINPDGIRDDEKILGKVITDYKVIA